MSDVNLGGVPADLNIRDAVHVAVISVEAAQPLQGGMPVVRWTNGKYGVALGEPVGIVDPFRTHVGMGEKFWLFLLPGTVTGMRNHWEHPKFRQESAGADLNPVQSASTYDPCCGDEEEEDEYEHVGIQPALCSKEYSRNWLEDWCSVHDCPRADVVIEAAKGNNPDADLDVVYFFFRDRDAHADIPREFWEHMENLLERRLPNHPKKFSCSC